MTHWRLLLAGYGLTYMDEFVDELLTKERVCDIILPRIPKRELLEETEGLAPRNSVLLDAMEEKQSVSDGSRGRERSRSGSQKSGSIYRSASPSRSASRSVSPADNGRYVSRSPSRSRSRSNSPSNNMETDL